MARAGFPDVLFSVEDLIAVGHRVVARWKMNGTQGPFAGSPPVENRLQTAIVICQIPDAKIVRARLQPDSLGLRQ